MRDEADCSNGNKYWENPDEQPGRNRWVDYAKHDFDCSQIDPAWHAWLCNTRLEPPPKDPVMRAFTYPWQLVRRERVGATDESPLTRTTLARAAPSALTTP